MGKAQRIKQRNWSLEDTDRYTDLVLKEGYSPIEAQAIMKRAKDNLKTLEERE